MITIFESIRYKNVLATGETWTTVDLRHSPSTMIIGANGAGKSTVMEALFFAGWGKAFRDIRMDQLINLKNQRGLLVELTFLSREKRVMVRRGLSPDVFEIFVDGELLPVPSSKKLYQKTLVSLLGIDRDTASQIIFVSKQKDPFMRLSAAARRTFVENILNLTIFQQMTKIKEARLTRNRTKISDLKAAVSGARDRAKVRARYAEDLIQLTKTQAQAAEDEIRAKIEANDARVEELFSEIETLPCTYPKTELRKLLSERDSARERHSDIRAEVRHQQNLIDNHTDTCAACGQLLPEDHAVVIEQQRARVEELSVQLGFVQDEIDMLTGKIEALEEEKQIALANMARRKLIDDSISQINAESESLRAECKPREDLSEKIEKTMAEVKELETIAESLKLKLHNEVETENILKTISLVLSDKGLKSAIIARMIPVFNRILNENLAQLGLNVVFQLDENFQETIRFLGFETMTYHSFSEGEKLRIDMAVLLTWRAIAKTSGAFATNLLFFDEVFDSSLDTDGAAALTDVLEQTDDLNVFVITHTPEKIADRVRSIMKFKRVDGFSQMVVSD